MPVRAALELTTIADCPPWPAMPMVGALTMPQLDAYVLSLEDALQDCRGKLEVLRKQEARRAHRPGDLASDRLSEP